MKALPFAIAAAFAATPALAHVDPVAHGSLASGMTHPLFGADHLLAMVGTGLLAAVMGGRAVWALPAAFVGSMVVGYALALGGIQVPMIETTILASVFVLGCLIALSARLSLSTAVGLVGVFGVAHGAAHGGELGQATALAFGMGFVIVTAALHAAGVALGLGVARAVANSRGALIQRVLGGAVALGGSLVAFG